MSKPNILVLGGVGFIGRNFVQYLVENDLAGKIRVADKVLPPTAYLTPKQQAAFEKVEFKQGNLVNPTAIEKIFTDGDVQWDYVVNLAAETKYSQTDEVYEEKVYLLSVNCAKEAAKRNVKKFVELSTAQVYDADKKASKEDAKIKPWTLIAKYKLKAEEELKKIAGLNLVILRPAIVYGPSDVTGLTPRLIMGAVYKELNEEMKLLWTKELRLNTVHVRDVSRAIFHLFGKGANGSVYNLADKGDTDQEAVNTMVGNIFKIKTGFHGTIISNMVKLNLESATEEINDKHLQPWSDVCKKAGITNTPLTPYLDKELLYNNSLSVDGTAIEATGFTYEIPKLTEAALREALDGFIAINIFPKGLF